MPYEFAASAVANMLVFSSIIYGVLSPRPDQRIKLWSVIALPTAFNTSIAIFKHNLTFDERLIGLLATGLICGAYAWLLITGRFPPRRSNPSI